MTTKFPNGLVADVTGDVTGGLYLQGTSAYDTNGPITIEPGIVKITKAGVLAATLANPTAAQEGLVMAIISTTANAHTVDYTAGFGDVGASADRATFAGAKGNHLLLIAMGERWYILASSGITLS